MIYSTKRQSVGFSQKLKFREYGYCNAAASQTMKDRNEQTYDISHLIILLNWNQYSGSCLTAGPVITLFYKNITKEQHVGWEKNHDKYLGTKLVLIVKKAAQVDLYFASLAVVRTSALLCNNKRLVQL